MEEIVIKNVLDAVHYVLHTQKQYNDEKVMAKVDKEIVPFIEENFEYSNTEFRVKHFGTPVLVGDKRIKPILLRYYAMCQNNVDLLEKLEQEDYSFIGNHHSYNFFALDRQLSTKFKEKTYIHLLVKHSNSIERFYDSLRGLDYHEREKYMRDFADMVKHDQTVLSVGETRNDYCNFLTRRNIELFGKDFLLSLDKKQRKLVNSFHFQIGESNIDKVKELVIKYPDFKMSIPLYKDILDNFSVDELGTMSDKDAKLYAEAIKANVVDRVKDLLKANPLFNCPPGFIRYEIFKVLDNKTILSLSEEAKDEIVSMRFVELKNAYVFPVKKLNKIVTKDKIRQKIESFIENKSCKRVL